MTYQAQFSFFSDDKLEYLTANNAMHEIKAQVKSKDFRFLSQSKPLVEHEFNQLFAALRKKGPENQELWQYLYYCCLMLTAYYKAYDDNIKKKQYQKIAKQIQDYCETGVLLSGEIEPDSFLVSLKNSIVAELNEWITAPRHVSKLRNKIGFLNMYRIYWAFCRMTLNNLFLVSRDAGWIDRLNKLLNKKIDVDKIIKNMEAANIVFKPLSVGFFAARFLLNAGMVIKHTFFPTRKEAATTSKWGRFCSELRKRHPDFVNDLVWGTVNALSNYAPLFHIAAPVAGWLTAGFLFFDAALLLWRRKLARMEYLTKKAQYMRELAYFEEQYRQAQTRKERDRAFEQCSILKKQLDELEIGWQAKNSMYLFCASAALILAAGFTISMVLSPGGLAFAACLACVLAVSMYLSCDEYAKYRETSMRLENARLSGEDVTGALTEYKRARNEFWSALAKNALIPGLIIGAYMVCWQAALVLTAAYLTYELWRAWCRHKIKLKANNEPPLMMDSLVAANDASAGDDNEYGEIAATDDAEYRDLVI